MAEEVTSDMTPEQWTAACADQLARWVAGESVHLKTETQGGQCCPDFSCCVPELKASDEVRQAFAAADDDGRTKFLGTFLGAAIARAGAADKVHIAGRGEPE